MIFMQEVLCIVSRVRDRLLAVNGREVTGQNQTTIDKTIQKLPSGITRLLVMAGDMTAVAGTNYSRPISTPKTG